MHEPRRLIAARLIAGLAACLGGGSMPGCGSPPPHEEKGDLSVQVTLPATVVFDSLTYQVSGNGIQPIVRNVTIVGSPTTGFAYFSGLPAHPGYDVEVNGTSHDGLTICAASGKANILPEQTTSLSLTLGCATKGGDALVTGVFACHLISSVVVAPEQTSVGGGVTVAAQPIDLDAGALTYSWTATSGTFANPSASNTTFVCGTAGSIAVTVTATSGQCSDRIAMAVQCVAN
jgi:hypothetical protein